MNAGQFPYQLYGIQCGKGWACLYQPLIERCEREGVQILQIKQKFAGLRFYISNSNPTPSDELHTAIAAAQADSFHVCEECGAHGERRKKRGLVLTLCDAHNNAFLMGTGP